MQENIRFLLVRKSSSHVTDTCVQDSRVEHVHSCNVVRMTWFAITMSSRELLNGWVSMGHHTEKKQWTRSSKRNDTERLTAAVYFTDAGQQLALAISRNAIDQL